jgi:tetratricopeptide (TPR) repeat protein
VRSIATEALSQIETVTHELKTFEEKLNNDPSQALQHAIAAARYCPHSATPLLAQAKAYLKLKKFQDVGSVLSSVKDGGDKDILLDVLYLKGVAAYYTCDFAKAQEFLGNAVRLDSSKAAQHQQILDNLWNLESKKLAGNNAYDKGTYQAAVDIYTTALSIDPEHSMYNAPLYGNRAAALLKLDKNKEALSDCSKAIEADPKYLKAYLRRAKIWVTVENFEGVCI